MRGTVTLTTDVARALLRVEVAGFLDMAGVHEYQAGRLAALDRIGAAPNQHISLYEVSGMTIQSQDVMAAFKTVVDDQRLASRRLAFVVGGSAVGMQIRRIVKDRDQVACFNDVAAAEAWLLSEEVAPLARAAAG